MITARPAHPRGRAVEKEGAEASLVGASMKILLWLAASAVDEPEMPAKNTDSSTLICASDPGQLPTMVRERCTRRSVMPPIFIRLAVNRKNGTASRMNEL